ncbi:hypothetical protein EW145_g5756 [Phellinidium pouzarii]|uniref:DUF4203 domain-containing protein n=1 Tax=Phellinidium pouzarii TaxID=167371 RepID=A0A4S4L085_9AGAM|nr:hypothetical protein EW145_g5756 [Phellinidium pouzarii]
MTAQLTTFTEGSTPFLLAYAVPLLLFSIVITLAGTFLTLDRTRTFRPRANETISTSGTAGDNISNTMKGWNFCLDGGIGGLVIGYVFGLHASTFLSLLIMNESVASPLTSTTFLVVWIFSVIPTTVFGARWRAAALFFIGITGGICMSLALCIITHPSLVTRIVLSAVITPITILAVLIPALAPSPSLSLVSHTTARIATSCIGALSMTMAIALLTRSSASYSWANVWDRLWVSDESGWGTARERGFDALFCVLWAGGASVDWGLRKWVGEDPDEKWDAYLAEYTSTLPNPHDRAGKFRPLPSWWERLLVTLHISSPNLVLPHEIFSPSDAELSLKPHHLLGPDLQRAISPAAYSWVPASPLKDVGFLKKGRRRGGGGFTRVLDHDDAPEAGVIGDIFDLGRRPTCLQKVKATRVQRRRQRVADKGRRVPVAFQPIDGVSSDSDENMSSEEDELKTPQCTPLKGLQVRTSPLTRINSSATSLSGTTAHPSADSAHSADESDLLGLIDVRKEKVRLAEIKSSFGVGGKAVAPTSAAPDYSDIEEDVTATYARPSDSPSRDAPGWKPEFIKRAASSSSSSSSSAQKCKAMKAARGSPSGAVPMTPSIFNAVERLVQAQAEAFGDNSVLNAAIQASYHYPPSPPRKHVSIAMNGLEPVVGLPVTRDSQQALRGNHSEKWDAFWRDIQTKAEVRG